MVDDAKFYRTVVALEILSDAPIESVSLEDVVYQINEGDWSGRFLDGEDSKEVNKDELQVLCDEHGTDIEFFINDE